MVTSIIRLALFATGFALAGCGGGGTSVTSVPTPPATPPLPPAPHAIVPAATTSQQFTAAGATHVWEGGQPLLDASDQLQVRYVQSTNSYEVQLPGSQNWESISGSGSSFEGAVGLSIRETDTQYATLFSWGDGATHYGYEAVGIATPLGGVPLTGNASYNGQLWGSTSEIQSNRNASMSGGIQLNFDFGLGSLSGSITPFIFYYATYDDYTLSPVNFRDTVYSTGSTSFSGQFDTNLPGLNGFTGIFAGPGAQELLGSFAIPYQSPVDGQTYQADGAFVGAK